MMWLFRRMRPLYERLLHLLEPFAFYPYCELCEKRLRIEEEIICQACWDELPPAAPQWIAGDKVADRYPMAPFAARFSLWAYDAQVERVIHAMKYGRRPILAREMGRRLAETARTYLAHDEAAIVPVPLHRSRQRERGYNQSELLARELASGLGLPLIAKGLRRTRVTRSQATLTREERLNNVRGAFTVDRVDLVRGRRILLVDDVVTTGSTASECARALLEAGAREVVLVTAAAA